MEFDKKNDLGQQNANLNLYPTVEVQTNEKNEQKNNFNNSLFNNSSLLEFIKIFSLLKSKKLDMNSLLTSSLGKNLSGLENISDILSLFKPANTQSAKQSEKLPKISSLERIN